MSYVNYNLSDLVITLRKLERGEYVTPWEKACFYHLIDKTNIKNEHLELRVDEYLAGDNG